MSKRGEGNRKKVLFFVTFLLQLTPVGGQHGGVEKKAPAIPCTSRWISGGLLRRKRVTEMLPL
jgi:hypothetical protein